jgi:hypothetical protein
LEREGDMYKEEQKDKDRKTKMKQKEGGKERTKEKVIIDRRTED